MDKKLMDKKPVDESKPVTPFLKRTDLKMYPTISWRRLPPDAGTNVGIITMKADAVTTATASSFNSISNVYGPVGVTIDINGSVQFSENRFVLRVGLALTIN